MEAARPKAEADGRTRHDQDADSLIDYCARPLCRKEFRRAVGPGRRQAYCSDFCRRTAERELRRTRIRLAHYESVVGMLRTDLAAFGKLESDGADSEGRPSLDDRREAEDAVRRAAGALAFADHDEPAVQELQRLYEAVLPLILPDRATH